MERSQYDLLEVLDHIEPAELDYQQWLNIGMALDLEGYSVDVWDKQSPREQVLPRGYSRICYGIPLPPGRLIKACHCQLYVTSWVMQARKQQGSMRKTLLAR